MEYRYASAAASSLATPTPGQDETPSVGGFPRTRTQTSSHPHAIGDEAAEPGVRALDPQRVAPSPADAHCHRIRAPGVPRIVTHPQAGFPPGESTVRALGRQRVRQCLHAARRVDRRQDCHPSSGDGPSAPAQHPESTIRVRPSRSEGHPRRWQRRSGVGMDVESHCSTTESGRHGRCGTAREREPGTHWWITSSATSRAATSEGGEWEIPPGAGWSSSDAYPRRLETCWDRSGDWLYGDHDPAIPSADAGPCGVLMHVRRAKNKLSAP